MQRALWIAVAAATACYRPALDGERCVRCGPEGECPGSQPCNGGYCGVMACTTDPPDDSGGGNGTVSDIDGTVDDAATPQPCTLPSFQTRTSLALMTTGDIDFASYTRGLDDLTAFPTDVPRFGITEVPTNAMFREVANIAYDAPHLARDRREAFVRMRNTAMMTYAYTVSQWDGASARWDDPSPMTVTTDTGGVVLAVNDVLSVPTTTVPRRMVIAKQSPGADVELWELVEQSSATATWLRVRVTQRADFGLDAVDDPSVSPDGLTLVFIGRDDGVADSHIYSATRTSVDQAFTNPKLVFDDAFDVEKHPFLHDCSTLYFYASRAGVVRLEP